MTGSPRQAGERAGQAKSVTRQGQECQRRDGFKVQMGYYLVFPGSRLLATKVHASGWGQDQDSVKTALLPTKRLRGSRR